MSNDRKNDYTRYQEIAKDVHGNPIGYYSKGDIGSIHSTKTPYGWGHTTLHPDGGSHHHDVHAHNGHRDSWTRDGKFSRK